MGRFLPRHRLAIRRVEHPLRQGGGGIVWQEHVQRAGGSSARQHPNFTTRPPGGGNARAPGAKLLSYVAILPWVRVPHLASHILGTVTRRLSQDWQEKYGHPIHLVETFVERDRFAGTCYRAAGWRVVGLTTGRGRNGPAAAPRRTRKEVLLQPLGADFRRRLRA